MSATLRDAHKEALRVFCEVKGVDKALLQQIIEAVEPQYLSALRNCQTNSITMPLHDLLTYLTNIYGRVTPQMLADKTQQVDQMTYLIQLLIDVIFNAVDDLADYAELAGTPLTQAQTVNQAYLILLRTNRFTPAITEWNRRPANQRNWTNFKEYFRRAHQELRKTTNLTLEEAERQTHQANLIQQVIQGVQDILQTQQPPPPPEPVPEPPVQQVANSATNTDPVISHLITQLQQMQQSHNKQIQQLVSLCQPTTNNNRNQNNNRNWNWRRNPNTSRYCWTHGGCNHDGNHCRNPAEGHQAQATFTNRMGGSTRNVRNT